MGKNRVTRGFLPLALSATMMMPTVSVLAVSSDISGHWAEKVITEWQEKGLIQGYSDGTFKPNNTITRAEFVTLMNNAQGYLSEANITFTDVKEGDWFYSAVAKAAAAGYTKGYSDGSFQPGKTITRAEAAVMIANAAGLTADESGASKFTDAASIPAWARGSVGAVVAAGFMSGYPDGSFGASASISRAEAVSSLNRVLNGKAYVVDGETEKDMVIEDAGTVIENETITGDLTISEEVGEGNVTLREVTVEGDLIIKGGGANSIFLDDVKVNGRVLMQKDNVHLHLTGGYTDISRIEMNRPGRITKDSSFDGEISSLLIALEGAFSEDVRIDVPIDRIQIEKKVNLILGADVDRITFSEEATDSTLHINASVTIGHIIVDAKITITGTGEIETLEVNVTGVRISDKLKTGDIVVSDGEAAPIYIESGSSSGNRTSSTSGSSYNAKKIITGVVDVAGIEVAYGTDEASAIANLPDTVTLTRKKGANIDGAEVTWALKSGEGYNATPATAAETVIVVGTVTVPRGYKYKGTLTTETSITVLPAGVTPKPPTPSEPKEITGVATTLSPVMVNSGTDEATAMSKLPGTVTLNCADGSTVSAAVAWVLDEAYDANPTVDTRYAATGTVTIPSGYSYSGTLTVETTLTVSAEPVVIIEITGVAAAVSPVTVDNGTSEATAMSKLPVSVMLNCADGSTVSANVAWVLDKPYDVTDEVGSTYHATGTVTIPTGYSYNGTLTVETTLTVSPIVREVTGIATTVSPIQVNYATDEATAMGKLPQRVTLNVAVNKVSSTTEAEVAWVLDKTYDAKPDTDTVYTATGTVTMPTGYTYNGTGRIETTLTVLANSRQTIKEIQKPDSYEVAYGTTEETAKAYLPKKANLQTWGGDVRYADVTWERKSGSEYQANPSSRTETTYIGTVTLPDGYFYDGELTIETTIAVLPDGEQPTKKQLDSSSSYAEDYRLEVYTEVEDEIKAYLPDEVFLKGMDGSLVSIPTKADGWKYSTKEEYTEPGYVKWTFGYSLIEQDIPDIYEKPSSLPQVSSIVYVKERNLEQLQAALDAAWKQVNRIVSTEAEALSSSERVYGVDDSMNDASKIATGVKFVCLSDVMQEGNALSALISGTNKAESLCTAKTLNNQAKIDAAAQELNDATAAFQEVLEQHIQLGTGYTRANILENVRQWLDKGNSNYAYSASKQPLTQEKHDTNGILLPQTATDIKINAAGDMADVDLQWSIAEDTYAELRTSQDTGSQYVWVKGTADEPKNLSLTVRAMGYYDSDGNYTQLDSQVEAYNNLIVGAPIARDKASDSYVTVDELISGKEQTVDIQIPLHYNSAKIAAVDATKATAQCSDGSLTGDIAVNEVLSDSLQARGTYTVLQAKLTATTKQLDAVLDSDKYEEGKVTLSIPYGAVTLTEWATEQGWYIPKTGLNLEADVKIYNPVVKVTKAATDSETEVRVNFNTEYWGDSYRAVRMALVPENVTNFTGSETGCFKSTYGEGVSVDAYYDITIPVSGITAGEKYYVWVKVGDNGEWMKSQTIYTP